jgi:hypothetical protein
LPTEVAQIDGQTVVVAAMPHFMPEASIPSISVADDPRIEPLRGRLLVRGDDEGQLSVGDGLLGQVWFGGRVWTFDYPGRQLLVHSDSSAVSDTAGNLGPLGFPINAAGRRGAHLPSIDAAINGETHAFLFDTGATVRLSDSALAEIGGESAERGTCFITTGLFEQWRTSHRDWKVVANADLNAAGEPMIEVPSVVIAGLEVGPVWFTRRADRNFHEYMSSMMDRRVEGALGGSLFEYFRITVDYPNAIAIFEGMH